MAVAPTAAGGGDLAQFAGVNPQMLVALNQLLPTLFGSRTNTTQQVSSSFSPQASAATDSLMAALLPRITGTQQSDAVVQNILSRAMQQAPGIIGSVNQGGYNSTVGQQMMAELIARATGEASGAVLQSQQQAAQTAAGLTAATQQNTRSQTSSTAQRTPGQGLNLSSVLAGVSLIQKARKELEDFAVRRGAGSTLAASTGALSSLPASAFSTLGAAGPVANAFGPVLGGTSGLGATLAGGLDPAMFSLSEALGFPLSGDVALSGVDGVFSGGDLLDFSSIGGDLATDAATGFAMDAGAGLLGDFGADMFAESFATDAAGSLAGDAAFSFGTPYLTIARIGSNLLEQSDIPVLSDIAAPVADLTNAASDFISEGVDIASGFFDVFEPITGGTVVCTHMYQNGHITRFQYLTALENSSGIPEVIKEGYRAWAVPLVKHMEKRPCSFRSRTAYKYGNAYVRKAMEGKHNLRSAVIYAVGIPACAVIGSVLRLLGKQVPRNRSEAGI